MRIKCRDSFPEMDIESISGKQDFLKGQLRQRLSCPFKKSCANQDWLVCQSDLRIVAFYGVVKEPYKIIQ